MSKAQKLEFLRRQLMADTGGDFGEDLVDEIVWLSKELGVETDAILEWSAMKYDTIRKSLKRIYEKQQQEGEDAEQLRKNTVHTLR